MEIIIMLVFSCHLSTHTWFKKLYTDCLGRNEGIKNDILSFKEDDQMLFVVRSVLLNAFPEPEPYYSNLQ